MIKISKKNKQRASKSLTYTILTIVGVVGIIPFIYLILRSFDTYTGVFSSSFLPDGWTFNNYIKLFTDPTYRFGEWYLNTFIIAVVTCIIQTMIVLVVSYSFSRLKFKGKHFLMRLMLILGMFPGFLGMIAIYNILKVTGLSASIFSLIIVYCGGSAMGYYIAKGFFDTIPYSLDEAAKIDGASANQVFFKIILPLAKPIIIYTVLMSFLGPWGDFMFANLLANNDKSKFTVAVGLQQYIQMGNKNEYFSVFCAGAVIVSIPIVALFFYLQKYYVEGVTGGSVKG